jgi:hypothetical protein
MPFRLSRLPASTIAWLAVVAAAVLAQILRNRVVVVVLVR